MTTTVMVSPVTPVDVAPPLSTPWGKGRTQGGVYFSGTLMRPVAGSQRGDANASFVPTPAPSDAACAAAPVAACACRAGAVAAVLAGPVVRADDAVFASALDAGPASVDDV